ncbi:MAG: hypothetical protein ABL921_21660 [Pirellula sp.]
MIPRVLLLGCLVGILAAFHSVNRSLPMIRSQHPGWTTPHIEFDSNGAKAYVPLPSRPNQGNSLEYNFVSRELKCHSSDSFEARRALITREHFVVRRKPTGLSFNESFKLAMERAQRNVNPESEFQVTTLDDHQRIQSIRNFSLGPGVIRPPLLVLDRFAIGSNHENIFCVDLAEAQLTPIAYPLGTTGGSESRFSPIASNRILQARNYSDHSLVRVFEVLPSGEIAKVAEWSCGAKPKPLAPGTVTPNDDVLFRGNQIYSRSLDSTEIEVRSDQGEHLGDVKIAGIDLSLVTWDWYGGLLCAEVKTGEFRYFDLELQRTLTLPEYLIGSARVVGANEHHWVLEGLMDIATGEQVLVVLDRRTDEVVRSWAQRPSCQYSTINLGVQTLLVASDFQCGLSIELHDILNGTVQVHRPFEDKIVWLPIVAIAIVTWAVGWLYVSKGSRFPWLDVTWVAVVLIGMAIWRLSTSGSPLDTRRLPYEYASGVSVGVLAVACMHVASTYGSFVGRLTPLAIALSIGHWLIATLLNERAYHPPKGMFATTLPASLPLALGGMIACTFILLVAAFAIFLVRRMRSPERIGTTIIGFKLPRFSLRDAFWIFALVAIAIQPMGQYNLGFLEFLRLPWPAIFGNSSAIAMGAIVGFAWTTIRNKVVLAIGWAVVGLVLIVLGAEFVVDFVIGMPHPLAWRILRMSLTAFATTYAFAYRLGEPYAR